MSSTMKRRNWRTSAAPSGRSPGTRRSCTSNCRSRSSMADQGAPPSLAVMNFEDDLKSAMNAPDAARWKFERKGPLELWVTVSPGGHFGDIYVARLLWLDYPGTL